MANINQHERLCQRSDSIDTQGMDKIMPHQTGTLMSPNLPGIKHWIYKFVVSNSCVTTYFSGDKFNTVFSQSYHTEKPALKDV